MKFRKAFFSALLFAIAISSVYSADRFVPAKCGQKVNIDSLRKDVLKSILDSVGSAENLYVSKFMAVMERGVKPNIYGAFAPQYPLMFNDYVNPAGWTLPVSVKVKNYCDEGKPCRWRKVLLKAWIPGYTDTATVTKLVNPYEEAILSPQFIFDTKALARLTTPRNTKIELRTYVLDADREVLFDSQSDVIKIHPMDVFHNEDVPIENQSMWYGVWVTPNMDSISAIHEQIGKISTNGAVLGDVSNDVTEAVKAVYDVLSKKHIKYINNATYVNGGQKIKYPIQVLQKRQAYCLEGVFLFSSILESLGLQPLIVLVPNHAILGWYTNTEKTQMDFLETTMAFMDGVDFETANRAGIEVYNENVKKRAFEKGDAQIIDIDQVRRNGIMPNDY